ncbi:MAG: hypothetical protein IJ326_08115 [Lachnospiraceae bacterium]|nr:hypothetical protein [Lachnospiraceae bacterium]
MRRIKRRDRKSKVVRVMSMALLAAMLAGTGAMASVSATEFIGTQYTVEETSAVLYSCKGTVAYASPDFNSVMVTTINANLPVQVVGVTSNGWFQIDLGTICYVPGYSLTQEPTGEAKVVYTEEQIQDFIRGTYAYYDNAELSSFTVEEIEEMNATMYIRYMDSFLAGNGLAQDCIVQTTGDTLQAFYEEACQEDSEYTYMSMRNFLTLYRNEYLEQSYWGPCMSVDELKITLNRALRYGEDEFITVYKNATVGSDKTKMNKVMSQLKETMLAEQGVMFSYQMSYGSYETEEGNTASGWILEFARG